MHLQAEADALGVEDVEDRRPRLGERLVAALNLGKVVRRERVQEVPNRRARKAVHLRHAESCSRPCGVLHALGGAAPHAFLLAVAPHVRRQDRLMARVDAIADGLPDEVRAERPALESVPLEELPPLAAVGVVRERAVDLEMVAPAGELEPVEPPGGAGGGEIGDGQVGPLPREQRDRSGHRLVAPIGGCRLRVAPSLSTMVPAHAPGRG